MTREQAQIIIAVSGGFYNQKIFSIVENKKFHEAISNIHQGYRSYQKNANGEYELLINNKLIFTDGNYEKPQIYRIIEIMTDNSQIAYGVKELIDDAESGIRSYSQSFALAQILYGKTDIWEYRAGDSSAIGWVTGRREGRTRKQIVRSYQQEQDRKRNDRSSKASKTINNTKSSSNGGGFSNAKKSYRVESEFTETAEDILNNASDEQANMIFTIFILTNLSQKRIIILCIRFTSL